MIKFDEVEYRGNLTKQIAAINKGYEYAKEITADGYSNIFFVAVGGTMAMMLHFAAIAKQKTKIPVYVEQAAELVVAGNTQLNKDSLVIMGSKSGDTKETVAAAKWCKERGIRIASMVIDKESPLGQLTDYQLPLVVFKGVEYEYLSMFGLFYGLLNCNGDFPEYDQFVEALAKLPDTLVDAQKKFDEPADAIAKKYFNADYMMWIGSGELWGEVYLFSMCILEEMQWTGPVFKTSGLMSEGTKEVVYYLMDQIEEQREREAEDPEYAAEMKAFRDQLEAETREQTLAAKEAYREMRRQQRLAGLLGEDDDDDEDDGEMEVYYVR